MALSPYKSHSNSLSRIRSSSCSSPLRNRIVFQEIYSVGANTLVRSYSCDQVFDKDETGQTFQTTKIQVSSFITPEKKLSSTPIDSIKGSQTEPKKYPCSTLTPDKFMAKKRLKMGSQPTRPSSQGLGIFKRTIKFSLIPLLSAWMFYFYISHRECGYIWDLKQTNNELVESVIGQNDAIAEINLVLDLCNNTNDIFTMIFTGGVGVGKTYSSSIISHNFPWSFNKLITFSDTFNADVQNLLKKDLSPCGINLITIDGLSFKNSTESINFIKLLYDKRKNEKLLIILIFQTHTETEKNEIIKDFKYTYFNYYHVPFKNLSKDVVEECFNREIQRQGVQIPKIELDKLIQDKMSHIDIVKGPTGCKGVADEVSYYYKKSYK